MAVRTACSSEEMAVGEAAGLAVAACCRLTRRGADRVYSTAIFANIPENLVTSAMPVISAAAHQTDTQPYPVFAR